MSDIIRERFNPIEIMDKMKLPFSHIHFNPKVEWQYRIIRTSSHDGTKTFSDEIFTRALEPLAFMSSYYIPLKYLWETAKSINYEIGYLRRVIIFKKVNLTIGLIAGQRESIVIPVKCMPIQGA